MDGAARARRPWRGAGVAVAVGLVVALAPASPAAAASISLSAAPTSLTFGETASLSGSVAPPPPSGTTVEIVDADAPGSALTSATTDAGGSFSVAFTPQRNVRVAARVGADQSAPVQLLVRATLTAGLNGVTLFGTAVVSGRLGPDHPGASVKVTLLRGDKVAGRVDAPVEAGEDTAGFTILPGGPYRGLASFGDPHHEPAGGNP